MGSGASDGNAVIRRGGVTMACIDIDALTQYENDARKGRPDALYNLGLAYSTGQGVSVEVDAADVRPY